MRYIPQTVQAHAPQVPVQPAQMFDTQEAWTYFQSLATSVYPDLPENSYFTEFMKVRLAWIDNDSKKFATSKGEEGLSVNLVMTVPAAMGGVTRSFQFPDRIKHIEEFAPRLFEAREYFKVHYPADWEVRMKNTFAISNVHETIHLDEYHPELNDLVKPNDDYYREESRAWWVTVEKAIHPLKQLNQPMDEYFERYDEAYVACNGRLPCKTFDQDVRNLSFRKQ